MTIQISIIGLGELGASIGLALKYHKNELFRVGTDIHKYAEKYALEKGAIDKAESNLFQAVKDADIILLALPTDETEKTMKLIGQEIKDDAVVIDFCPAKSAAKRWADEYLKNPTQHIGLYPSVNHDYLEERSHEHHSAREDLMKNGNMFVAVNAKTDAAVVKLAADFTALVGAYPIFSEAEEIDGLIASTVLLPALVSGALLNASAHQKGWIEARKITGKEFETATALAAWKMDSNEAGKTLMANRENLLRLINELIPEIRAYRDALQNKDESALSALVKETSDRRETWLQEYERAPWRNEQANSGATSSFGDIMGQMFLGGIAKKREK